MSEVEMADSGSVREAFLEPIYLNEKMVLNCAAYVFQGYSLESEIREQTQSDRTKSLKIGLEFLNKLLTLGGDGQWKQSQLSENKTARRYTIGGLHMSLLDELHARDMLAAIDPESLLDDLRERRSYVEIIATLRPVDFYAVISTLRSIAPIIAAMTPSIVGFLKKEKQRKARFDQKHSSAIPPLQQRGSQRGKSSGLATPAKVETVPESPWDIFLEDSESYISAFQKVLDQLEEDYRRSRQLEMVMWSDQAIPRPIGVVDLDLGDYGLDELRAKLAGGTFHLVGKATRVLGESDTLPLLQKSSLYSLLALIRRIVEAYGSAENLGPFRNNWTIAKQAIERFGLQELNGPAVRLAAMSVCI